MRQRPLKNFFRIFLLIALGQTFGLAAAQSYPNKSIRIVVPFPAGGGTDIVARILANDISKDIGQNIMVENKGGANGILGADLVAKSTPDGYTIVMSTMGNLLSIRQFIPIVQSTLSAIWYPSLKSFQSR